MPGVTTAYQNGVHGSRPAASAGCILYACSTHSLIYRSDGSAWSTWMTIGSTTTTVASDAIWDAKGDLAAGTGADTASKLTVGTNGLVLVADSAQSTGLKWGAAAYIGCRVYNSGQQTITNNTATPVTYDSEDYDTNTLHSIASNTSRFTADRDGYWQLRCWGYWNTLPASGLVLTDFLKNNATLQKGTVRHSGPGASGVFSEWTVMYHQITVPLVSTDYLEWRAFQNSGVSRDLGGGSPYQTMAEFQFMGT